MMLQKLKDKLSHDNLEFEFLPPALEIEETPPRPFGRILIWIILVITVSTFLWAYFGRVDEVAVARGKIIPDGKIKVIQPLESGVIRAIHVTEGQKVSEGQLLIELDPTIKQADAESTVKTLSIRKSDKHRLLGELNGKGATAPTAAMDQVPAEVQRLQGQLKEARESEYCARVEAQKFVVSQREYALQAAKAILIKLQKAHEIVKEQATAYKALYENEYIARMEMLDKQKEFS
jgi:hemolysin D